MDTNQLPITPITTNINTNTNNKSLRIKPKRHVQTKKNKSSTPKINKKELWLKFQQEIKEPDNNDTITSTNTETTPDINQNQIECVYRSSGEREECECCSSPLMTTDEGFLACINRQCGIIYKDSLEQSAEWRYYGADDTHSSDPTRCGMPINPLLQESSFGCKVLSAGKQSYEMRKIRRYTQWQGMPYREKAQYDEFQKITILASQAGIPKLIVDDAMRYHKKISEAKSFRGLNRDGIIAASIYVASRINQYPRTAKEIATIFHLDNTAATRGCKNAISILNELEHTFQNDDKTALGQTNPIAFIERFCSKLNMNQELTKLCKFIAIRIQKNNLIPENTPHSIAAGIIYFVGQSCNINISKRSVSTISEISEVTINKCYKKLAPLTSELIPAVVLEKYSNYAQQSSV
jgi:transcription initiation factor TFIIB